MLICKIVAMIKAIAMSIIFTIKAFSGNNENMKKASSPVVVINAAIKAGKLITL